MRVEKAGGGLSRRAIRFTEEKQKRNSTELKTIFNVNLYNNKG